MWAKIKRSTAYQGSEISRHWTANDFGRCVLAAENNVLARLLQKPGNRRVIELAAIETPASELPVLALFSAARETWRQPVIATLQQLPLIGHCADVVIWRYLALERKSRLSLLQDIARILAPSGMLVCCHLNPMYSHCWQHAPLLNLGYQSATVIVPSAKMAGLHLQHVEYAGPGWWKYRALRISVLRKPLASRVSEPARARNLARQPAAAMLSRDYS